MKAAFLFLALSAAPPAGAAPLAGAAETASRASRQDLFRAFKPAVVGVALSYGGIPVDAGSGFFLSKYGELAARYSLLAPAFLQNGIEVTLRFADGTTAREFRVADCGGPKELDLCLLKVDHRPEAYFPSAAPGPFKGQRAFLLGRVGYKYEFSDGMVNEVHGGAESERLELSNPVAPEEDGAAVLSEEGKLLGMAGPGSRALPAEDILAYADRERGFMDVGRFRQAFRERRQAKGAQMEAAFLSPAQAAMENGEDVGKVLKFKLDFRGPRATYRGFLPDLGWQCGKASGAFPDIECAQKDPIFGTLARFRVKVSEWKRKEDLSLFAKARAPESEPGELVRVLRRLGRWQEDSALLDERQTRALYSRPQPAQCDMSFSGVFKGRSSCDRVILDDALPGGSSLTASFLDNGVLFEFSCWTKDPGLSSFYLKLPRLFASTLLEISVARRRKEPPRFDENWLKLKP